MTAFADLSERCPRPRAVPQGVRAKGAKPPVVHLHRFAIVIVLPKWRFKIFINRDVKIQGPKWLVFAVLKYTVIASFAYHTTLV